MTRNDDYQKLLVAASGATDKALRSGDVDVSNSYALTAIACVLLARELRESKESEEK